MMRLGSLLAVIALTIPISTSAPAAGPDWPKSLTLATASPGGAYYIYGEELAHILTERLGIAVTPLRTQGAVHNVKLSTASAPRSTAGAAPGSIAPRFESSYRLLHRCKPQCLHRCQHKTDHPCLRKAAPNGGLHTKAR
jgi:hypothetical protein